MHELKKTVKEFLDFEYQDNLPQTMFQSKYPKEGSKRNKDFENEVFGKARELGLEVHYVDSFGGEGEGEDYWSVYSFTKNGETVYVKFDGSYASYVGSEYDEWFFVEPEQVMVTQFHRIKG
jgi:hypothetical protein